jgi:hypothetical protein
MAVASSFELPWVNHPVKWREAASLKDENTRIEFSSSAFAFKEAQVPAGAMADLGILGKEMDAPASFGLANGPTRTSAQRCGRWCTVTWMWWPPRGRRQ